jgi:hypothetical protein
MKKCFGCASSGRRQTPQSRRAPTQAEIEAARMIQRVFRGASTRSALRSGALARKVRATRTTALKVMSPLPANITRQILSRTIPRVPGSFSRKHAPQRPLSPALRRWLLNAHTNANQFGTNANYQQYINRVANFEAGPQRSNKIRAILARYELLKPDPRWPNWPESRAWRNRLEANFRRKYVPRRANRLSSRELYSFLLTAPTSYLNRVARTAPTYV